jgi:hypothetical protein
MNMTQVIKISVVVRIRILATDGCVASEYIYLYIRYITTNWYTVHYYDCD